MSAYSEYLDAYAAEHGIDYDAAESLYQQREDDFLAAFAIEAEIERDEAGEAWAAFSRQLPDRMRLAQEMRGFEGGSEMGREHLALCQEGG